MHSGDALPVVTPATSIRDALLVITQKGLGMTTVVDQKGALVGMFTDGDLRRVLDNRIDVHNTPIEKVMTTNPTIASPNMLAVEGLNMMQEKSITGLLLCENNQLVGALSIHDLLKAGVM